MDFEEALKIFFPCGTIIKNIKILNNNISFYFSEINCLIEYKDNIKYINKDNIINELVKKYNNCEPFYEGDDNDFISKCNKESFDFIEINKGKELQVIKLLMDKLSDIGMLQICMNNYR